MIQVQIRWILLTALLFAVAVFPDSTIAGSPKKGPAKDDQESVSSSQQTRSSSGRSSSSSRGLPSLDGLTHGLGLGLRKKRAISNNKKPTGKESTTCTCPSQYAPVCGSDGKTYSSKCMFQCAVKKAKSQMKKPSKNSNKNAAKAPALKIVKNGKCATTETESGPTTTTASPLDMVHQTATELSNTAHETVEEHAPMLSSMTTPSTSMVDDAHSMAHIRSKSKH